MSKLTIATRQSPLALWQAHFVADLLKKAYPGLEIALLPLVTQGDKILGTPLAKIGGKGLFVKELEQALLDGRADIAVHSLKDVPMQLPPSLTLGAILERHDPFDALIDRAGRTFDALPSNSVVGTSSLRRACQLKHARGDLHFKSVRGNVGTRLGKLEAGECDALILAKSGLMRLGLENRITQTLSSALCLPAGGQGALGVECATDKTDILAYLKTLTHTPTLWCVTAERALNQSLGGSCQAPIAAHARLKDNTLTLQARVLSVDGSKCLEHTQSIDNPNIQACAHLGGAVANALRAQGADMLLQDALTGAALV